MRKTAIAAAVLVMLAACGSGGGSGDASQPSAQGSGNAAGQHVSAGGGRADTGSQTPGTGGSRTAATDPLNGGAHGGLGDVGKGVTPAAAMAHLNPNRPRLSRETLSALPERLIDPLTLQDLASRRGAVIQTPQTEDYRPLAISFFLQRLNHALAALVTELETIDPDGRNPVHACSGGGQITLTQVSPRAYQISNCVLTYAPGITANGTMRDVVDKDDDPSVTTLGVASGESLYLQGSVYDVPLDIRFERLHGVKGGWIQDGSAYTEFRNGTATLHTRHGGVRRIERAYLHVSETGNLTPDADPFWLKDEAMPPLAGTPAFAPTGTLVVDGQWYYLNSLAGSAWNASQGLHVGQLLTRQAGREQIEQFFERWDERPDEDDGSLERYAAMEAEMDRSNIARRRDYKAALDGSIHYEDPVHYLVGQINWSDPAMQAARQQFE